MKHIEELKRLSLPKDDFAIFGSGPMAVRGIRENKDLDLVVTPTLWEDLKKKLPVSDDSTIKIGNIEIFKELPIFDNTEELIDNADIIDGFKFVKLNEVIKFKKALGREKDLKDIKLIENFLKK